MLTDDGKLELLNSLSGLDIQEKGIFRIYSADDISYYAQECVGGIAQTILVTHSVYPSVSTDPTAPSVHLDWTVPDPWHGDINYTWNLYDPNGKMILEDGSLHVTPHWTDDPCTDTDTGERTHITLDIDITA